MNKDQKTLLKPHADHFAEMAAYVVTCDRDELAMLDEACKAATPTNCGWDIYRAARYLAEEIKAEQHQRLKNRAAAADSSKADSETT